MVAIQGKTEKKIAIAFIITYIILVLVVFTTMENKSLLGYTEIWFGNITLDVTIPETYSCSFIPEKTVIVCRFITDFITEIMKTTVTGSDNISGYPDTNKPVSIYDFSYGIDEEFSNTGKFIMAQTYFRSYFAYGGKTYFFSITDIYGIVSELYSELYTRGSKKTPVVIKVDPLIVSYDGMGSSELDTFQWTNTTFYLESISIWENR